MFFRFLTSSNYWVAVKWWLSDERNLSQELLQESYEIKIFDITGKLVASPRTGFLITETGIQFIFKKDQLHTGIYMLEVSTYKGERLGVVKIVVENR